MHFKYLGQADFVARIFALYQSCMCVGQVCQVASVIVVAMPEEEEGQTTLPRAYSKMYTSILRKRMQRASIEALPKLMQRQTVSVRIQ